MEFTEALWERFRTTGPGLPTIELPLGLDLLHEFAAELETALRQREQLVLAEKLFDMEITSYPQLAQLEGEMKKLHQIYAVYAEHAEAVRQYAQMLWSELDVSKMMASTEEISTKLRKLKHLKLMPTYELVEKEIQGFYNSLPLMKELKSDALRKRHWSQLMEVTGQNFEMDSKTFTLGNMFSMQLHKYAEEIVKITNAAIKELTIESEIKKLADVWREQKFELGKYMKVRTRKEAMDLSSIRSGCIPPQHFKYKLSMCCAKPSIILQFVVCVKVDHLKPLYLRFVFRARRTVGGCCVRQTRSWCFWRTWG